MPAKLDTVVPYIGYGRIQSLERTGTTKGGKAQAERAAAGPAFMAAVNGAFAGRLIPVPGGVLVRDGAGRVIGAVGVTGDTSDNDAEAALAGIAAAGLTGEA